MDSKIIYYSVDRIEDNIIFLLDEEDTSTTIKKNQLTFKVKEGDILAYNNNGFYLDKDKTEQERKKHKIYYKSY